METFLELELREGDDLVRDIVLAEGGTVRGWVTTALRDPSDYLCFWARTKDEEILGASFVKADGSFEFRGLPPGVVLIRMQWRGGPRCDDTPSWVLELVDGGTVPLDFDLLDTCALSGTVRRNGEVARRGERIRLDGLGSAAGVFYTTHVDELGQYGLWTIAPGRYVVALDDSLTLTRDASGRLIPSRAKEGPTIVVPSGAEGVLIDLDLPADK